MPALPSFRLSPDQLEKYSSKAAVASEHCLTYFNGILANLSDDEKASTSHSQSTQKPAVAETKAKRVTNTRTPSSKAESKTGSASQTTELLSLMDMDIPLEASTTASSTTSASELLNASCPSSSSSSSSKRSSFSWRRKSSPTTPRVQAQVGERITSRCRLGDASIEGDFTSIQFGTHNGRPACRILVDFRLVFQPASTINWVQVQFRFGSDSETTGSQTTKSFFPNELTGQYDTSQEIRAISPNIGLGVAGCKASISGISQQKARVKRRRWRVQGTREEHTGVYDTFCWKVIENEFSEDSVPRHFCTGMVVYLPSPSPTDTASNADSWVDISIEGTLRGLRSKQRKVQERRWFEPTIEERTCQNVLTADVLATKVHKENQKILDLVSADCTLGPGLAFPALPAPAAASVDVPEKPAATESHGPANNSMNNSTATSYEILQMEGTVHMLAADRLVGLA